MRRERLPCLSSSCSLADVSYSPSNQKENLTSQIRMLAGRSLLNRLSEHQNWGFRRAAGKRVSVTVSYLSSQKAQRLQAFVFPPSQSDSHAPVLQPAVCQIPRFSYMALKLTFYGFISAVFGLHCVFTLFIGTSSQHKSSPYGTRGMADAHAANSLRLHCHNLCERGNECN